MSAKEKQLTPYIFILSIFAIGSTLFNVALTSMGAIYIIGDLGGSTDTASYAITFFGLGNAIVIPLADYLRKKLGFQRSILYCSLGYIALTFLIAFSPNYPIFLLLRFFQGFFSGPLFIIIVQLGSAFLDEKRRETFLKCVMLNFLTSPILGACFGGTIAYEWSWTWSFILDGILLCIIFFLLLTAIWRFDSQKEDAKLDWIGAIFFAIAVICLGSFITLGQELDWFTSDLLTILFLKGVIALAYFIVRSLAHPNPLIDLRLLRNYQLSFSLIQMTFLFSTYFGVIILLSLWLSLDVNYTPNWVGIVLLAMMIATTFLFAIFWRLRRRDSIWLLGAGIVLLAMSSFYSMRFNVDIDFGRIAIARLMAGAGFALFFPPVLAMCIGSCGVCYKVEVLAYFQLTRVLSSSIGVAVYTTMWQRRHSFYHSRMGGELTSYSFITDGFLAKLKAFHLSSTEQFAKLAEALDRQTKSLAINDCLYFMGWIMVILFVFLALSAKLTKIRSDYINDKK